MHVPRRLHVTPAVLATISRPLDAQAIGVRVAIPRGLTTKPTFAFPPPWMAGDADSIDFCCLYR